MTAERMPLPFGVCRTEGARTVIEKGCLARPRRREWLAIEASSCTPSAPARCRRTSSMRWPELCGPRGDALGQSAAGVHRSGPGGENRERVRCNGMITNGGGQGARLRIEAFDDEFAAQAKTDDAARRLASIPGIGVLNATALSAAVGNAASFARGRDLAAWLGLVPRQMTTGGKPRLMGISKRGNKYLRKLLVHGARAALPSLSASTTPLGKWLKSLLQRAHKNTVIVALANKLARIVWAVLRHGGTYDATAMTAA